MEQKKNDGRNKRKIICIIVVIAAVCIVAGVIVKINDKPVIAVNGSAEVQVDWNKEYQDAGAVATFRKENISDQIQVVGDVDTSQVGTYEIDYQVNYRNKVYQEKRIVHVVDRQKPNIALTGKSEVLVSSLDKYEEPGYVATDNYDGDITQKVEVTKEDVDEYNHILHYRVSDSSGNVATAERKVIVKDHVFPEIALLGDADIVLDEREKYTEYGATAKDNRDGDLTDSIQIDGYVDIYRPGTYTVTYTVKDSSGNKAKTTRQVTVNKVLSNPKDAIYLTFDDGPSPDVTKQILTILKENNIKATFFICNYNDSNKKLVQRMIKEGHTVGIHGYSHDYAKIYESPSAFMENIYTLKNKIKADTGYDAFVIRFPGGSSNTVSEQYCKGIMTDLVKQVTDEGLMYLDWNVSNGDAEGNNRPVEVLLANATGDLEKNRSNVILMHDTSNKQTTADSLQALIDYGIANGYSFYPVSENTVPIHHALSN